MGEVAISWLGSTWVGLIAGLIAGLINAVAGAGSAITLSWLVEAGLELPAANASNRITVLLQAGAAVFAWWRAGELPWRLFAKLLPTAMLGAGIGIVLGLYVDAHAFSLVTGIVFLSLAAWSAGPRFGKARMGQAASEAEPRWVIVHVGLFLCAVFGGFLQVGSGLVMLLIFTGFGGMNSLVANAVKLMLVFVWTVAALVTFSAADLVHWRLGTVVGLGGVAGAYLGARFLIGKPTAAIRWIVTLMLVILGVRMMSGV